MGNTYLDLDILAGKALKISSFFYNPITTWRRDFEMIEIDILDFKNT